MAMSVKNVKEWLDTLDPEAEIGIDGDDLKLVLIGSGGLVCLEVGDE